MALNIFLIVTTSVTILTSFLSIVGALIVFVSFIKEIKKQNADLPKKRYTRRIIRKCITFMCTNSYLTALSIMCASIIRLVQQFVQHQALTILDIIFERLSTLFLMTSATWTFIVCCAIIFSTSISKYFHWIPNENFAKWKYRIEIAFHFLSWSGPIADTLVWSIYLMVIHFAYHRKFNDSEYKVFHILHGSYYAFLFFSVLLLIIISWIEIKILFSKTLTDVETHRIMDYATKDQQQSSYHVDPSESDTDSERADNEQSKRGTVVYELRRTKEMKLLTKFSRYPIPFLLSVVWWVVFNFCVAFHTKTSEGTIGVLDVVIEVSRIFTPMQGFWLLIIWILNSKTFKKFVKTITTRKKNEEEIKQELGKQFF